MTTELNIPEGEMFHILADIVGASGPRPTKRTRRTREPGQRRTRDDIQEIKDTIYELLDDDSPMTCRQLFYLLVSRGAIAKTEVEYKSTVIRLLKDMRLDHTIPFGWIADNTRWMRKPDTHNSMEAALEETGNLYRRALWRDQPVYVEVWCEKDALAGVLLDVTAKYDVPLMVSRGYASLTYLYETAQALQAQAKPCYLYHFGDHDPSGVDILRNIERRLREFAPDAELCFEKIAVTSEQIEEFGLLTRPTKKTDTRSSGFEGESVDVDAIPPKQLRALAEACIVQHIDDDLYERSMNIERAERESFSEVMEKMWGDVGRKPPVKSTPRTKYEEACQVIDGIPEVLRDRIMATKDCYLRNSHRELSAVADLAADSKRQAGVVRWILSGLVLSVGVADYYYECELDGSVPYSVVPTKQYETIYDRECTGESVRQIAADYGVDERLISLIADGAADRMDEGVI